MADKGLIKNYGLELQDFFCIDFVEDEEIL